MDDLDNYRRDVAGRFLQALKAKNYDLVYRWFPDKGEQIVDEADRRVEDEGLQTEGAKLIGNWIRSESDAQWLDGLWQDPQGSRFLDLCVELLARTRFKENAPHVPVPPLSDVE